MTLVEFVYGDVVNTVTSETETWLKLRDRPCHKSPNRDLEVQGRDSRPYISLMVNKANSLTNSAKNICNVAKYQDNGVCRCYASINFFGTEKFVNCLRHEYC